MFKVGQDITYRDINLGKYVTVKIIAITEVIDSIIKEDIGRKVCYVREDEHSVPYSLFEEDLLMVLFNGPLDKN